MVSVQRMATWGVHYRTRSLGGSKLAQFSLRRKVKSSQFCGRTATPKACASQQQPVDEYQDWETRRWRMRKQSRSSDESLQAVAVDHRSSSAAVSVYMSVSSSPALSRTGRLHPRFSTFAPAVHVAGSERRGTVLLLSGEVALPAGRQPRRKKKGGIWAAALATAATSMMLGMAMVGRPHSFPQSSSSMLHPPLPAVRTHVSGDHGRGLAFSSPTPTNRGGLDPKSVAHPTPFSRSEAQRLRQPEAWQLADLAVDCIDLTVIRAAAYESVFEIPDPRRWGCWVSDQAGVMTGQAVEHMNALIDALRYDTATEVTVVTIEAISDESLSAREFAERLFNFWGMDRESDGNNILFLLVRSQGKLEVQVGRALEKTLRQGHLWGADDAWLASLTNREAWPPTLRKNKHGEALMVAVENLGDKVWGAAGLSLYQPASASSWWRRTRVLLDVAWLTVPILLFCANVLLVRKPAASIFFGHSSHTWASTLKTSLKTVIAWMGSAYEMGAWQFGSLSYHLVLTDDKFSNGQTPQTAVLMDSASM